MVPRDTSRTEKFWIQFLKIRFSYQEKSILSRRQSWLSNKNWTLVSKLFLPYKMKYRCNYTSSEDKVKYIKVLGFTNYNLTQLKLLASNLNKFGSVSLSIFFIQQSTWYTVIIILNKYIQSHQNMNSKVNTKSKEVETMKNITSWKCVCV